MDNNVINHPLGSGEKSFNSTTNGTDWSGKFISRSGPFHRLDAPIPCKGFRGFRYIEY